MPFWELREVLRPGRLGPPRSGARGGSWPPVGAGSAGCWSPAPSLHARGLLGEGFYPLAAHRPLLSAGHVSAQRRGQAAAGRVTLAGLMTKSKPVRPRAERFSKATLCPLARGCGLPEITGTCGGRGHDHTCGVAQRLWEKPHGRPPTLLAYLQSLGVWTELARKKAREKQQEEGWASLCPQRLRLSARPFARSGGKGPLRARQAFNTDAPGFAIPNPSAGRPVMGSFWLPHFGERILIATSRVRREDADECGRQRTI